ncbi:uncharacterized protein LOC119670741 [Teleopsis dalmanni]|uniref:uncharacterized protein LOC119670741 n=1 Tax=Teleopsis dalmanni TaxID=139649 RepID=UPI0018CFCA3F|nr:uncharacterized protein LOC119670741 [Teleopsis dalmanni]
MNKIIFIYCLVSSYLLSTTTAKPLLQGQLSADKPKLVKYSKMSVNGINESFSQGLKSGKNVKLNESLKPNWKTSNRNTDWSALEQHLETHRKKRSPCFIIIQNPTAAPTPATTTEAPEIDERNQQRRSAVKKNAVNAKQKQQRLQKETTPIPSQFF